MTAPEPLSSRQRSDLLMKHLDAAAQNSDDLNTVAAPTPADYYFGYGLGPNNLPSLEAVKT